MSTPSISSATPSNYSVAETAVNARKRREEFAAQAQAAAERRKQEAEQMAQKAREAKQSQRVDTYA